MAPVSKNRGVPRQPDLALEKYIASLDGVPDEGMLGRLQNMLETLLSERSHPMIIGLSKQMEQLKTAENVIQREVESRKHRSSSLNERGSNNGSSYLKRKRSDSGSDELTKIEPGADEQESGLPKDAGETRNGNHGDDDESEGSDSETVDTSKTGNAKGGDQRTQAERPKVKKEDSAEVRSDDSDQDNNEDVDDDEEDEEEDEEDDNEGGNDAGDLRPEGEKKRKHSDAEINGNNDDENLNSEEAELENKEGNGPTEEGVNNDGDDDTNNLKVGHKTDSVNYSGNKKFVANPKSEFVSNQSLPYHTFGIFNEDHDDSDDEELFKRRLGVVSYPKEDLSTLTAGPVPMDDYTRAKPSNQVQFSTYATFLEPYFRQFTDDDIQFLQQSAVGSGVEATNIRTGKRLSPFAFPPLGPHYQQQWAAQDAELAGSEIPEVDKKLAASRSASLSQFYAPKGSVHDLSDQSMESSASGVSLGPFTERLVAAVMPELHETGPFTPSGTAISTPAASGSASVASASGIGDEDVSMESAEPEKAIAAIPPAPSGTQLIDDFGHLEERVKGEFRYVGVLDMSLMRKFEKAKSEFKLAVPQTRDEFTDPSIVDMDWINGSEDDEVSRELRFLQGKLKEVTRRNAVYKSRLLPVIQEQLAWQEYQSILQDLDKQVDQAYQKRLKQPKVPQPKQKKRNNSVGVDSPGDGASPLNAGTPDSMAISKIPDQKPAIKALMDKRERWLSKIGPLFRPAYEMMREYETRKFNEIDEEDGPEDEDDDEREE